MIDFEKAKRLLSLPAAFYKPNTLGVRGLNEGMGEWALKSLIDSAEDQATVNPYVVIGGLESAPKDAGSLPETISRFPWEAREDTIFRTVKSASKGDPLRKGPGK